jgi:hypothetical protein
LLDDLQHNKHVGMTAGKMASMMSCRQASLSDGKRDVMQAGMTDGQHDGWHWFSSMKKTPKHCLGKTSVAL